MSASHAALQQLLLQTQPGAALGLARRLPTTGSISLPSAPYSFLTPSQQLAHSSLYPVLTEEIPPQPYACRDQAHACTQARGFRPAARLAAGIISAQNLKGKV